MNLYLFMHFAKKITFVTFSKLCNSLRLRWIRPPDKSLSSFDTTVFFASLNDNWK